MGACQTGAGIRAAIDHDGLATIAHRGQVDKAGKPYIDHPRRVAGRLAGGPRYTLAAAWLHDVLEDVPPSVYSADVVPRAAR